MTRSNAFSRATAVLRFAAIGLALGSAPAAADFVLKYHYESNIPGLLLGCGIGPAGDVNGDGYGDLVASTSNSAWLFYGSALGPFVAPHWAVAGYGNGPVAAGDVNGDGYQDIITGFASTPSSPGHVYLFAGGPTGPGTTPASTLVGPADSSGWGSQSRGAGDVDGDGYDDLVVLAPNQGGSQHYGRISLYRGTSSGLASSPAWSYTGADTLRQVGYLLLPAGDVNGDGYCDLVVVAQVTAGGNGPPLHQAIMVFHGSGTGFPAAPSSMLTPYFTIGLAGPGDVNGDGYADMLTSTDDGFGAATSVFLGSPSGLVNSGTVQGGNPVMLGDLVGDGTQDYSTWMDGYSCLCGNPSCVPLCGTFPPKAYLYGVAGVTSTGSAPVRGLPCDVDGDGVGDLGYGNCGYSNGEFQEGAIEIWGLKTAPVSKSSTNFDGTGGGSALGTSVAAVGDLNGDGFGDVVMGAPGFEGSTLGEGRASLFLGTRSGLGAVAAFGVNGGQPHAAFGSAVAGLGDVNGDGYSDFVVGAPTYSNGENHEGVARAFYGGAVLDSTADWSVESNVADAHFGASVARAGDVTGDGYADLLVAAPGPPNLTRPQDGIPLNDAHVTLYPGSSGGLATSSTWTVSGYSFEGFAAAICGAGDVNGDGYSDVAVGIPGLGEVRIYHGSSTGLAGSPATTLATGGNALAAAGDVNGDGYDDLIVGSPNAGGEVSSGRAELFLGSSSGLSTTAAWTVDGTGLEKLGGAVSGGGDFNDDGFSDVVVGRPAFNSSSGGAHVYLGSPTGPSTTPAMTITSSESGAQLGSSLAEWDVSGDGYAELFLGAPGHVVAEFGEGRVEERFGSESLCKPLSPQQAHANSGALVDLLGSSGVNAFQIRANAFGLNGRAPVRLEWQVHALGAGWGPLQHGAWVNSGVPRVQGGSYVSLEAFVTGLAPSTPYAWRVRSAAREPVLYRTSRWASMPGNGAHSTDLRTGSVVLDAPASGPSVDGRLIAGVYPNPAATAGVRVTLGPTRRMTLDVLDVGGRRIRRLMSAAATGGPRELTWDARDESGRTVRGGLYFIRAVAGARSEVRRVVMLP